MKKTSMANPVKSLGNIKCYSSSRCRHIKGTSNSTRYNCQKVCSWLRRPKTILEIKKVTFFQVINKCIIYKFFKDILTTERRLTRRQVLAVTPFPNLNIWTTDMICQESGKQDSFRHILKSLASTYESLGSQFFRTTT